MKKKNSLFPFLILIICMYCNCTRRPSHDSNFSFSENRSEQRSNSDRNVSRKKSVIKMQSENGVYYIPCKINGVEMQFIFDTGASDITMSLTEALFLYKQGKIKDEDLIGTQQYQIADGSIHEGMVVEIHTVEIGDRKLYNVRASIVENMDAPLLLGQSALSEFGKISIDYSKNEITFE